MNKNISNMYRNTTVDLDGQYFEKCIFQNCTIRFSGNDLFSLVGCKFESCKWSLDGPAANTIQFLRLMYKDMGDFGKQMVEATFENIKK
ncbi:hypothetical protein CV237_002104 [Salmonella enterica subsp. enterica serovar Javiana]|uniref:Uncharacterized protein n=2 Tax=Salmonella enterica I TaxID=59201 RepID=A0A5H5PS84_SALET|nr:hypothetical protein [Salmonella enterica]EAA6335198.1 hypothetical protein [Salmonella enterica subsp. enterica serovar Coeln]EAA6647950.1 hypothetical protein [Salmonella enterica subsp. enterica serovar Reading]EAP2053576.1 hypothetical protein [Salmonella enterica subsp. enterica serovar 4,[5],12:i:-]EBH2620159.1 hypothetical protein [Salmonella enterica subsp. enterica]EBV9723393.1 hypothetical protein [Salmonella enterica subsp. enterica serovar Typhimurium var. 5-]ECV3439148.1 hypot